MTADEINNDLKLSADELKAKGYSIDESCYPWFAYKGPRMQPDVGFRCNTPSWTAWLTY